MRNSAVLARLRITSPWLIFSVALVFRVAVGLRFFLLGGISYQWSNEVAAVARSLVLRHAFAGPYRGYGGPTAWLAPGYPFITAGVFRVFGINTSTSGLVLLLINALFASMTAVVIYELGCEFFTKQVALVGAWLWALSPIAVMMPLLLWDTTMSAFLFSLSVLLLLRAASLRQWVAAGSSWGLAALFSPALVAPLLFIFVGKLWQAPRRSRAGLVFCASMLLVLMPWSIRNYVELRALFPVRSNGWAEIYFGNISFALHPCARPDGLYQKVGETAFVHQLRGEAISYIRSHPGEFLWNSLQRAVRFWLSPLSYLPLTALLAALSLGGSILLIRERRTLTVLLLAIPVSYPVIYSMTHIETRYRNPIEPVLCLLCAYALCWLFQEVRIAGRQWRGERTSANEPQL